MKVQSLGDSLYVTAKLPSNEQQALGQLLRDDHGDLFSMMEMIPSEEFHVTLFFGKWTPRSLSLSAAERSRLIDAVVLAAEEVLNGDGLLYSKWNYLNWSGQRKLNLSLFSCDSATLVQVERIAKLLNWALPQNTIRPVFGDVSACHITVALGYPDLESKPILPRYFESPFCTLLHHFEISLSDPEKIIVIHDFSLTPSGLALSTP